MTQCQYYFSLTLSFLLNTVYKINPLSKHSIIDQLSATTCRNVCAPNVTDHNHSLSIFEVSL